MKKFLISSLAILIFTFGCEEEKLVDEVFNDTTSGAVLRTLSVSPLSLNLLDLTSSFSVTVEQQDRSLGANFSEMQVFVSFVDNNWEPVLDADGEPTGDRDNFTDVPEVLVTTIPASQFTPSDRQLPSFTYTGDLDTYLTALGLSDEPFGGDRIEVRLAAVMSDGSVWTDVNGNNNITGGRYFSSPFRYSSILVCEVAEVPAGDWTINMTDSYGDGWQSTGSSGGPGITVTLNDGTVFEVGLCTPYEPNTFDCTPELSAGTATITMPAGITSAVWNFPGDFWGEMGFQIFAPSGNLVAEGGAGFPAGEIPLNLCGE